LLPAKLKIEEANTMDSHNRDTYICAKIERRETDSWMTISVAGVREGVGITQDEWIDYAAKKWPGWEVACVWNKTELH